MALGLMTMSAQAGPSAGGLKLEADAMPVQRVASRQVAGPGRHFRHIQNRRRIQRHIQIQRHKPSPPYGVGHLPPAPPGITPPPRRPSPPDRVGHHPSAPPGITPPPRRPSPLTILLPRHHDLHVQWIGWCNGKWGTDPWCRKWFWWCATYYPTYVNCSTCAATIPYTPVTDAYPVSAPPGCTTCEPIKTAEVCDKCSWVYAKWQATQDPEWKANYDDCLAGRVVTADAR
jgi:hypothetical protein